MRANVEHNRVLHEHVVILAIETTPAPHVPASTIDLHLGDAPGLTRWRKRLFLATSRITADAVEYFGLQRDRTLIMGSRIDV